MRRLDEREQDTVNSLVFAIVFAVLGAALLARAGRAHRQAKPDIEAGLLKMAVLIFSCSAVSLVFYFI
jgi:hypothetical protein